MSSTDEQEPIDDLRDIWEAAFGSMAGYDEFVARHGASAVRPYLIDHITRWKAAVRAEQALKARMEREAR